MAYTAHTWGSKEVISAAKLNLIENAIAEVSEAVEEETVDDTARESISNIESRLTSLESTGVSANTDDIAVLHPIPDYLECMYETAKSNLLAVQGVDTSSVGFICDTHYITNEESTNYSKLRTGVFEAFNTLAMLSTELPLNLTVLGGDICGSCGSADEGILALTEANKAMSKVQGHKVILVGDHDVDFASGSGSEVDLTMNDIYNVVLKQYYFNDTAFTADGIYAYYDDAFAKIRYIFLQSYTSAYSAVAAAWLSGTALVDVPDGYGVVVFSHFGIYNNSAGEAAIYAGTKTYLDLIASGGVSFLAWVSGHAHSDWGLYYNDMLVVCLQNAGIWNGRPSQNSATTTGTKSLGTENESAFSVLTFNRDAGTLSVTRFGDGEDITFTFSESDSGGEEEESGYTNQIPISTDADGNIYNDVGYKYGCHLSVSSGVISETSSSSWCSGFIPCTPTDVVRLRDVYPPIDEISTETLYTLMLCDSDKNGLLRINFSASWETGLTGAGTCITDPVYDEDTNTYEFSINGTESHVASMAYIRISRTLKDLSTAICTINEEIV